MYQRLQRRLRLALGVLDRAFDVVFGAASNPLYHLGALAFFFLWVAVASGIYLYLFFETSTAGAYASVEHLTREQWYLGGVMRSLHRYASDALVLTMVLHLLREIALDRFRGFRWFSWMSGVPLVWLVFVSGVIGYWLVWDRLAQYVALATTEWLDALGIFGQPIARNFLDQSSMSDRFFTLLVFLHIGVPLFLLAFSWLHVTRISRPRTAPPRALALGTGAALLALALIKPALSQGPADLDTVPAAVRLDAFYLALYPLFERWGYGAAWALVAGATLGLVLLPWLVPRRRPPVAVVDPANCNGCRFCFADCPYAAITMRAHPSRPGHELAVVDPALCAACGICAGSCPSATPFRRSADLATGIDLPQLPIQRLRAELDAALERLDGGQRVVVFGCDHGADVRALAGPGVAALSLLCLAQLPPSFVDYALRDGRADGVLVAGCPGPSCRYRLGSAWVEQRFARTREPYLRTRAARERVRRYDAGPAEGARLRRALAEYRAGLPKRICDSSSVPPAGEGTLAGAAGQGGRR